MQTCHRWPWSFSWNQKNPSYMKGPFKQFVLAFYTKIQEHSRILEETVSKWTLACGGSCLWGHYRFDSFIIIIATLTTNKMAMGKTICVTLICIWHRLFLWTIAVTTIIDTSYQKSIYFFVVIVHFLKCNHCGMATITIEGNIYKTLNPRCHWHLPPLHCCYPPSFLLLFVVLVLLVMLVKVLVLLVIVFVVVAIIFPLFIEFVWKPKCYILWVWNVKV